MDFGHAKRRSGMDFVASKRGSSVSVMRREGVGWIFSRNGSSGRFRDGWAVTVSCVGKSESGGGSENVPAVWNIFRCLCGRGNRECDGVGGARTRSRDPRRD